MKPDSPILLRSRAVILCAAVLVVVSLLVLTGWLLDIEFLKVMVPGFAEMQPNAAVGFLIMGFGLFFVLANRQSGAGRIAAGLAGAVVYLIGALTLGEYLSGSAIGTGRLLFPSLADPARTFAGYMSPFTAFGFALLGLSLILINGSRILQKTSQFLATLTIVSAYAVFLAYLYKADALFGVSTRDTIAVHTVVLALTASVALLAANPTSRTVAVFVSDSLGGSAMQRLLPAVVLIPTLVGWVRVLGQDMGLFSTGFGTWLTIFCSVVGMVAIVLYFSNTVHSADRRRQKVELALAENEQRYRNLFDYSQGLICLHDLDGTILSVNPAAVHSLGLPADKIVGRNLAEFLMEEDRDGVEAFLLKIRNEGLASGLLPIMARNSERAFWKYHSILVAEAGKEPFVIGHAQDVTELVAAQQQLKSLSLTDELTGLYNRRGFLAMAEQQLKLERHAGTARGLSLLFADMDGLKRINDLHGHEAGSEAIATISRILRSALRSADIVGRWGGDEFVILTIGSRDENVDDISQRICERIDLYNAASDKPYRLACSIGIADVPLGRERTFESIIDEADQAMYAEKRRRRGSRTESISPIPPGPPPDSSSTHPL